jgi:hypothetical protein
MLTIFGLLADDRQTGNYSEPEVGFEESFIDLPQARFWTGVKFVSGLATTRPESDSLQTETWNPIFSNSAQRHRDRRCGRAAVDRDW